MPTMALARSYTADPASVPEVRRFVRKALQLHPRDLAERAAWVATELATNAVLHRGVHRFTVSVIPGAETVRVEVSGEGDAIPAPGDAEPMARFSPGVRIVDGLCDRWGTQPGASESANVLWFELDVPADAGRIGLIPPAV